jgi:type IV pilus assembly protein PilY1
MLSLSRRRLLTSPTALFARPSNLASLAGVGASVVAGALALGAVPSEAGAQELPRVLIMVDGSGNMAEVPGSGFFPWDPPQDHACATTEKTRWALAVEALTGNIQNYKCTGGTGVGDPNVLYSDKCTWQQETSGSPSPVTDWLHSNGKQPLITKGAGCNGNGNKKRFQQNQNGLIDLFSDKIRFGLMITDTNVDPGTGASGGWSYFTGGTNAKGAYGDQTAPLPGDWEVGVRNESAPAYQGRLMGFGANTSSGQAVIDQNERIQEVLLAFNPEWNDAAPGDASKINEAPVAAMLKDGYDFLTSDFDRTVNGTYTPGQSFNLNPSGACVPAAAILVVPGKFGSELRDKASVDGTPAGWAYTTGTPCTTGTGVCPYPDGPTIMASYKAANIPVHIIGVVDTTLTQDPPGKPWWWGGPPQGKVMDVFGWGWKDCTSIGAGDFGAGNLCDPNGWWNYYALTECCNLANLALAEAPAGSFSVVSDLNALKTALSKSVAGLASITSATLPAEAVAAPTIKAAGANPTETANGVPVLPSAFEILSTMTIPSTGAPWEGVLERRRMTCNATGNTPIGANIQQAKGDDFGDNLDSIRFTALSNRKHIQMVLMSTPAPASSSYNSDDSARPAIAASNPDGLNDTTAAFKAQLDIDLQTLTNGGGGAKLKAGDLGIQGSDGKVCRSLFGTSSVDTCARRTVRWLLGWNNRASDRASLLGGFFHSSPIVVGPPLGFIRDESYREIYAVTGNATNTKGQATRPTVTYAQTTDGVLHAFYTANNSGPSDYMYPDASFDTAARQGVFSNKNNELWSFVPPAVMYHVFPSVGLQSTLLDGPLTATELVLDRKVSEAAKGSTGLGDWHTVLVGASGFSQLGGFYYALDVTDPRSPQFLWQLSTGGTDKADLFGSAVPAPALTTVAYKDPNDSNKLHEIAVAILAGGVGSSPTGGLWSNTTPEAARSVTIVRLDTGEVLKRFEGGPVNTPTDIDTTDGNVLKPGGASRRSAAVPLLAPMTGTPVVFPGTPGVDAKRAYIGDAGGRLWRIDLSDPDVANWNIAMAFDAYAAPFANADRQPIENTPVISTDENGVAVIIFSTGTQDSFTTAQPGAKNFIVRLKDDFTGGAFVTTEYTPREGTFLDGERVTGPIQLFDSNLFFTTFAPSTGGCGSTGGAKLWGINYLTGAAAGIDLDGDTVIDATKNVAAGNVVINGAQLNRVPGCFATNTTTASDGWLAGNYQAQSRQTTGEYQLVFNGNTSTAGAFTQTFNQGSSTTTNIHLSMNAPKSLLKIRSWTAVSE